MNTENLLRVKALILEEPLRFYMGTWKSTDGSFGRPECETVACVAGWGATLKIMDEKNLKTFKSAAEWFHEADARLLGREFLGLTYNQAYDLFYDESWPEDLGHRLNSKEPGSAAYAQVAAEAIDRFIACGGDWDDEDLGAMTHF